MTLFEVVGLAALVGGTIGAVGGLVLRWWLRPLTQAQAVRCNHTDMWGSTVIDGICIACDEGVGRRATRRDTSRLLGRDDKPVFPDTDE